jgi:hemolysin III
MLATSALLHRGNWMPVRRAWRRADHSTIFLAITGSYFAIAGLTMHGTIRLVLLIVIGAGTRRRHRDPPALDERPKWANTIPYLVMSWFAGGHAPDLPWRRPAVLHAHRLGRRRLLRRRGLLTAPNGPALAPRVFGYHELFHAFTVDRRGLHFAAISVALR